MEWLLSPLRDFAQPWYASHPRFVVFLFIVLFTVLAALLGVVLLQTLFLKKVDSPATTSASGPTINFGGLNIERLTVVVEGSTPIPPTAPSPAVPASLVENGDFERGLHGWGTGFYEGLFLQLATGERLCDSTMPALAGMLTTADRTAGGDRFVSSMSRSTRPPYSPHSVNESRSRPLLHTR